jgi:GTP:adenosylcobinamide-phosphate guanylyltransferase
VTGFNALILAGSRSGVDPVADYAGVAHKGLIQLQDRTLLARVVEAVAAAGATRIGVSTGDAGIRTALQALRVEPLESAPGPSQSVRLAAETLGTPLLVTTVDHALLRPEWIRRFLEDVPKDADVAALVARRDVVEAAAPGTARTYLRFADGDWSGCNLFYLANARALGVVDLWRRVEAERKKPWRIAGLLGAGTLVSYATGRLTLDKAARRLGELANVRAAVVASPFGLAAVDVDKPADLDLVRKLVAV